MIIWVDEDDSYNYPSELLLRKAGHTVTCYRNATEALPAILNADGKGLRLAIVDVMLARGGDLILFSDAATLSGLKTGLVLVHELMRRAPSVDWKTKLLIHSRASRAEIVAEIELVSRETGVPYLPKRGDFKAKNFLSWLKVKGYLS